VQQVPAWRVFTAFVRLGATAFGGPAIVAHLKAELVGRRRWLTEADFADGLALCQIIPGATMVMLSTYAGYRVARIPGAAAAAIGFVLPAFVVMLVLSALYAHSGALPAVRAVFRGLGALVVVVVLNAAINLGRSALCDWQGVVLACLALVALVLGVGFPVVAAGAAVLALGLYRTQAVPGRRPPGPS